MSACEQECLYHAGEQRAVNEASGCESVEAALMLGPPTGISLTDGV